MKTRINIARGIGIIMGLLVLSAAGKSSEIETMEELERNFRPLRTYDHSSELLMHQPSYGPDVLTASVDSAKGIPPNDCLTLDVRNPGSSPYAVNMIFTETNCWKAGESGMIAFYCRTLTTKNRYGGSSLKIQYKPSYKDWRGHVDIDLYLTKQWKLVMIPFEVEIEAADTPETMLSFFLGGVDPHSFQLADLRVYSFGKQIPFQQLPQSTVYYPGIEADAPWRKAAGERIEKHRKANLELTIVDAGNRPLPDAKVHVKLKRHQFGFGAAVHSPMLVSPDVPAADRKKYSDILTRTCSKITPTNAMKWRLYPHFKAYVGPLIDWCEEHDMTLRGHLLIWPGYKRLPEGYDLYKTDPTAFRKDLVDHIKTFVNLYPDAFSEWDVMNEPYTEHDFMDLLGKDVVLEWFETARRANPSYLTYINDYGILSDNNHEHQNNYYDWITYLVENDAPLDGIGFQGHFRTAMPPEVILERIDRYAEFGKKMQITEFDFKHTDTELQARFFEDFMTLIYSHPQMSALINWIYLEDDFRPEAALYRKDFSPTAMGKVWERLLTQQWHTEESLTSDENGIVEVRGFKGLYTVITDQNGRTNRYMLTLDGDKTVLLKH